MSEIDETYDKEGRITVRELRRALSGYPLEAVCEIWEGADDDRIYVYRKGSRLGSIKMSRTWSVISTSEEDHA